MSHPTDLAEASSHKRSKCFLHLLNEKNAILFAQQDDARNPGF